jgi:hypothetical protein
MANHDFTLILGGPADLDAEACNRLFEAGCDDATPVVRGGVRYLSFDREAPTLREAVLSAVADVRKADGGITVIGIIPWDWNER